MVYYSRPNPNYTGAPSTGTTTASGPTVTNRESPEDLAKKQITDRLAAGTEWANTIIKPGPDGTFKHLSDDYRGQMDELLSMLKERTKGMDSKEMLAMREQGLAGMDQQLAQNMRRAGQIAGNAGVRGGAAAGLQMGALNQTAAQRAGLERQMILDNIAQKNQAFAAYGGALGGASDRALGVGTFNIGQDTKAALAPTELALTYSGLIDSGASGIKADRAADASTKLARDFLSSVQGGSSQTSSASAPNSLQSVVTSAGTGGAKIDGVQLGPNKVTDEEAFNSLPTTIKGDMTLDEFKATPAGQQQLAYASFNMSWGGADKVPPEAKKAFDMKYGGLSEGEADRNNAHTVICTEAMVQGLVSRKDYEAARGAEAALGYATLRNYWVWGVPTVRLMRKHPSLARLLAWFVPDTVAAIHGKPHRLRGDLGHAVFSFLTGAVKLWRTMKSKKETVPQHG